MPETKSKQGGKGRRRGRKHSKQSEASRRSSSQKRVRIAHRPHDRRARTPAMKMASGSNSKPARQAIRQVLSASKTTNQRVAAIVKAYALPLNSSSIRWASVYNARPTAVAHPKEIVSTTFSKVSEAAITHGENWPLAGEHFSALSRSPIFHQILYQPNPTNEEWLYNATFCDTLSPVLQPSDAGGGALTNTLAFFKQNGTGTLSDMIENFDLPVATLSSWSNGYIPGNVKAYFAGTHADRTGFWIDGNDNTELQLTIQFSSTPPSATAGRTPVNYPVGAQCAATVHRLNGKTWDVYRTEQIAGGDNDQVLKQFPILETGYYAVSLTMLVNNTTTDIWLFTSISITGVGPNYVHCPVPGLYDKLATLTNLTVHAASIMVSCKAAELAANGLIAAAQLETGASWTEYACPGPVDKINRLNAASTYNGKFAKGVYGFLKPTSPADLEPVNLVSRAINGRITSVGAKLLPPGGWIVVGVEAVPIVVPGTPDACTCYNTTCASIEYTTTDQWVESLLPRESTEDFQQALRILSRLGQFHENPLHWAEIMRFIRGAAANAIKVAPSLLRAIAGHTLEYGPMLNAGARGLDALGEAF